MPADVLDLTAQAWGYAPQVVSALLIFLAFWVAGMVAQRILARFATRIDPQRQQVLSLLGQVAKSTLLVIGFITALGTLGIDISALVAGLGLTGFALGFAFRDALSNLLAGVLILLYRPFQVGDRIKVANFEGQVIEIDLRYTTLQGDGQTTYLIPNSMLFTNPITRFEDKQSQAQA